MVVCRTVTGEEGFLADHIWACKLLGSGELRIFEPGAKECKSANISGGFIDVHGDVLIFADSAEWVGEWAEKAADNTADSATA